MSSPFSVFRKHQKTLIVIAAVICMFVFVIGDSLMPYLGGGGAPQGGPAPTAVRVRWDGGSLTNREMETAIMRRHMVNALTQNIFYAGLEATQLAGKEPGPLAVAPIINPETPEQGVEYDIVRAKVFAGAARKLGMTVSNETIGYYLDELGRGMVSREEMRRMITQMQGVNPEVIYDAIREEMLAQNYLRSYAYALDTVTPDERWRDWLRVNDDVIVEAAALPVDSYLVDVKDPTEEELVAFFEQYRNREPLPDYVAAMELPSAQPGFAVPRKFNLKYLTANYDAVLEKLEDEVTEEEIQQYYDEKKDPLFIKTDTDFMDELLRGPAPEGEAATGEEAATDEAQTEEASSEEAPAEETPAEESPSEETPSEETPSEETPSEETPSEETPSDETPSDETPSDETPSPESPADTEESSTPSDADNSPATTDAESATGSEENPADPASTPEGADGEPSLGEEAQDPAPGESSAATRKSPFRLASFLQESEPSEDAGEAAADQSATAETEAVADQADAPGEETSATPPAESTTNDARPSEEGADASAAAPQENATPEGGESADAGDEEKPLEFQPLDDVRDQIRRQIASEKAYESLVNMMNEIKNGLNKDFNTYFGARLNAEAQGKEVPAPPASLVDLEAIAARHGLEASETGLKSLFELSQMPIGQSVEFQGDAATEEQGQHILALLESNEAEMYQPKLTKDIDGNRYLVMKVDETKRKVPTLSEVRDQVVQAWKRTKAAELALKDAEAKAKQAEDSGQPLADIFADQGIEVVRTDPFTWLTGGTVSRITGEQQPFRLSEPEGIVAAGPAFFQTVFGLGDKKVGAVLNNDHSIAYVVRIVEHVSTPDDLHQQYLAEANTWDGLRLTTQQNQQVSLRMLLQSILNEAGVEWVGPEPGQQVVEDGAEEGEEATEA